MHFRESFFSHLDLYLFNEGSHFEIYKKLGAHKRVVYGTAGYNFSVWAPNAESVSVKGNFNGWDGRAHRMRCLGNSGIWEIFIPGVGEYEPYKFEIMNGRRVMLKSDPYGSFYEVRPSNASLTYNSNYEWKHGRINPKNIYGQPVAIYEMHLGSWRRRKDGFFLNYREISELLIPYLKETGFNWVEFMPVTEHPLDSSWGYQTTGFFAPTSRHGSPDDFRFFIDSLHKNNIGVILDWTPAHFPKDEFGLYYYDGTHLYEHSDPRKRDHPDWKSAIFNYGRHEVGNFLVNSALSWLEDYRIDALRVDGVASMLYLDYSRREGEWISNIYGGRENLEAIELLKKINTAVYNRLPGSFTAAEESTAWPKVSRPVYEGGLGFGFKWNMGWMHDTLKYFSLDPIHRKHHQNSLTFGLLYAFSESFMLPLSHDETVYGKKSLLSKMPGDSWQKFANLRLLLAYMYCYPGKKLLFMGGEFGQISEWNYDRELEWHLLEKDMHRRTKKFVSDLNALYQSEKALFEKDFDDEGFEWIDFSDRDSSIISFMRRGKEKEDFVIAIFNFTPVPRTKYRIGVPADVQYKEIFNSDSKFYGGGNLGNLGAVQPEAASCHNHTFSLSLTIPPLACIILKPQS
ncbi:MAG: 1,4-alpha-glucan branching protein GlgB [Candidatus Omnitrophica bacterium]|nr:1,4-alpha-glucan branching protein GlgB [Candidatus Omnitrophota bacterium]